MMMMKMMINVAGFGLKFEQPLERLIGTKRERERERERMLLKTYPTKRH